MKTLKTIGIFLAVLLAIFMLIGMYYGAMLFFTVLKLMAFAAVIVFFIKLHMWTKGKTKQ